MEQQSVTFEFVLPFVSLKVLFQVCYPLEFMEEPLVYGCQSMDLTNTHTLMEGL